MRKIWFGVTFVAVMAAGPAPAQDYKKNFSECVRSVGAVLVADGTRRKWRFGSEAQHMAFMDCVTRRASFARTSSTLGPARVAR